ncbi:hypothetical protein, partial [Deinococcus detaillensis]|uniref:hypothetical protein n=1 Tax=Deinococcus detaillensis TaxID=2592048 RepID=UPI001CDCE9B4
ERGHRAQGGETPNHVNVQDGAGVDALHQIRPTLERAIPLKKWSSALQGKTDSKSTGEATPVMDAAS